MLIKNGNVLLGDEIRTADIRAEENILEIGTLDGEETIDARGLYVFPGFVDIHTHGGGGGDFMDAEAGAFEKALAFHGQNGTTSLLATSVTAPVADILRMLPLAKHYKEAPSPNGAKILGVHLEGPYLSLKNKGAQHERHLRVPRRDPYDFILENADIIKTVTIAPELDGAEEMTRRLTQQGITVCGGHDDGYYEKIKPVVDAGLRHCTHLWCAMSMARVENSKRSIGLLETGLVNDAMTVELIADNHHISPEMVRIVHRMKGAEKMCLVSDSLRAGGMPTGPETYTLGPIHDADAQQFIVGNGVAQLPDGSRLAGSIQPLSQMLKNVVMDAGIPLVDAVKMVTSTPADILGEPSVGRIAVGKQADFCIMDQEFNVVMVIVNGKIIKGGV